MRCSVDHSMTGSTYSSSKSLNDSGREDVGSTTVPPRPSTPKSVVTLDAISEIDRIMAKLEQDNRILAELDRTRASIGQYQRLIQ